MIEPQNEIDPMIAANSDATTMCTVGDSPCWNCRKTAGVKEFRQRDQRDGATADAVVERHQLRHRGHLDQPRRRHTQRHTDQQARR